MAYEKQTWANYDPDYPLSAERMEHLETGIFEADKAARGALPRKATGLLDIVYSGTDGGFGPGSTDTTPHITIQSWQSPHNWPAGTGGVQNVGGYGQGVRLDVMDPLAKNLIVWRLPEDASQPWEEGTNELIDWLWMGAHYQHRNSDGTPGSVDAHFHWSVETPDSAGALQTRFQIKLGDPATGKGYDTTRILTTSADLIVQSSGGEALRMSGPGTVPVAIQFSTTQAGINGKRWALSAENTGQTMLLLRRYDSAGALAGTVLAFDRETGRMAVGTDAVAASSRMYLFYEQGSDTGLYVKSNTLGAGDGFAIRADVPSVDYGSFQTRVNGDALARFAILANGRMSWGTGAAARDVELYRSTNDRLTTPNELATLKSLRVGALNYSGGGVGVITIGDAATVPNANPNAGGILYVEGGALKYRSAGGKVTTVATNV